MDILLDVKGASKHLKCSRWTLYRIVERREISFIRKRRRILFKENDLEMYVNKDRIEARLNLKFYLTNKAVTNHLISEVSELASKSNKSKTRPYGYGNVYQRKTGRSWTMDFYDETGRRIQKSIPDAQNKEQAIHALQLEVGKTFDKAHGIEKPQEEKIGFRDFAKVYHDDYMQIVRRNFRPDVYRLQVLCGYFKNVDLRAISRLDVERFRASRLKRGNTKSTVNRYLQLMGKMFNLAIEEGYLEENPARKVNNFNEKDSLKERILTEKEEEKLLENCSDTLKSIIAVALNTGMRRAEILNCTWDQIDLKAGMIRVERTKSGKVRHIPINDDLFKQILKLKNKNGQSAFVFLNPATKKPFLDMKTPFKRACRISGIEGLRFHDLRHTFATRLVANGVDIETIKELLGHHSIAITQRYLHSSDDRKRKAVEILSKNSDKNGSLFSGKKSDKTGQDSDNLVTIENQSGLIN
ncbi:MAG: helix-turn-helix domain-containing protein [Candidatus Aminicenantes bacterium]|nr:MAG: helix-turn-helix domain-containing protein [Candidatus Aminicenantes bacterium]